MREGGKEGAREREEGILLNFAKADPASMFWQWSHMTHA